MGGFSTDGAVYTESEKFNIATNKTISAVVQTIENLSEFMAHASGQVTELDATGSGDLQVATELRTGNNAAGESALRHMRR